MEHWINGGAISFAVVTAKAEFSHQGFGPDDKTEGMMAPSTTEFKGNLRDETDETIYLDYFFGRTVPYVTGQTSIGGRTMSQYQQIQVGVENGAVFHLGKPLTVLDSDKEKLTITVTRVD